eukprot:5521777-Pyramimonas_sp.AAC.1
MAPCADPLPKQVPRRALCGADSVDRGLRAATFEARGIIGRADNFPRRAHAIAPLGIALATFTAKLRRLRSSRGPRQRG